MKTILIIEDERYIFDGLNFVFSKNGYEAITAANGIEALQILKEKSVDIILTDLCMPKMDGFETTKEIRKIPKYQNTPIIAYTGLIDEKYIVRARESGVTEILHKPLTPDILLTTLNKY